MENAQKEEFKRFGMDLVARQSGAAWATRGKGFSFSVRPIEFTLVRGRNPS